MKNFKQPLFLKIENQKQLDYLLSTLEGAFEMYNDMALDEIPFRASDIREMVGKSDDEINAELKTMRECTDNNIDRLIALRDLQHNLESAIDVRAVAVKAQTWTE